MTEGASRGMGLLGEGREGGRGLFKTVQKNCFISDRFQEQLQKRVVCSKTARSSFENVRKNILSFCVNGAVYSRGFSKTRFVFEQQQIKKNFKLQEQLCNSDT